MSNNNTDSPNNSTLENALNLLTNMAQNLDRRTNTQHTETKTRDSDDDSDDSDTSDDSDIERQEEFDALAQLIESQRKLVQALLIYMKKRRED
jgi:hypothetical protein